MISRELIFKKKFLDPKINFLELSDKKDCDIFVKNKILEEIIGIFGISIGIKKYVVVIFSMS